MELSELEISSEEAMQSPNEGVQFHAYTQNPGTKKLDLGLEGETHKCQQVVF